MTDLKDIYLTLEISDSKDKIAVASILIANGYTGRLATIKVGNQNRKVLQYISLVDYAEKRAKENANKHDNE